MTCAAAEDIIARRVPLEDVPTPIHLGEGAILFGAGAAGRLLLETLRASGCEPAFFVDNNEKLWGSLIDGVPVFPPSFMREDRHRPVVLCSSAGMADQLAQCRSLGATTIIPYCSFHALKVARLVSTDAQALEMISGEQTAEVNRILHDDASRHVLAATIAFHITRDPRDLPPRNGVSYFQPDLFSIPDYARFIDAGAFDGDTLQAFLTHTHGRFESYDAFEPDAKNFARLEQAVRTLPDTDATATQRIRLHQAALGQRNGTCTFRALASENSVITPDGTATVNQVTLDSLEQTIPPPTFVKMDIEGEELNALRGARQTIIKHRPHLAICVYHHIDHLRQIPLWIADLDAGYHIHMRRHGVTSDETICYAIPAGGTGRGR